MGKLMERRNYIYFKNSYRMSCSLLLPPSPFHTLPKMLLLDYLTIDSPNASLISALKLLP